MAVSFLFLSSITQKKDHGNFFLRDGINQMFLRKTPHIGVQNEQKIQSFRGVRPLHNLSSGYKIDAPIYTHTNQFDIH